MATEKLEFSLRLRHDTADLSTVTADLGLVADAGWDKGDPNRTLQGAPRSGMRDDSYRSFSLGVVHDTDLSDALDPCIQKLTPWASVLQSFVSSGGTATLAVGWFCDSAIGGGSVPQSSLAEMARLRLTLDLYVYLTK